MAKQKLEHKWVYLYCSSSVINFQEGLLRKTGLKQWNWHTLNQPTIFFGMYHIGDYIKFMFHRGDRIVFWCGSDVLNLGLWRFIIRNIKAIHYCENEIEKVELKKKGIQAYIHPAFFNRVDDYPITFRPSKSPHVFISCHPGRAKEYGIDIIEVIAPECPNVTFHIYGISKSFHEAWRDFTGRIYNLQYINHPNIVYHGRVSKEQFDKDIQGYQAGLRLNMFDGFGEVLAKSILLGQYPISYIKYPHIDQATNKEELIYLLNELKNKEKPNPHREFWYQKLKTIKL